MSEVQSLIVEAKGLLRRIEADVNETLDAMEPDATQLRIATNRLRLFTEQHEQAIADAVEAATEPEPVEVAEPVDDGLEALTRKVLNAKAAELGVDAPDKLPNKDAVVAAIREASEPKIEE